MELINNYQVPEGYKQTEVGVIPVDWDVVIFDECFDIWSGYGFKKSEYTNYGVKLLRIDNVSYGKIQWDSIAFLPIKYTETYKSLLIKEGDFLLALNRPITNDKLKFAIAKNSDTPSILYQRVGKIIRLSEIYDKDCAFHILYKFIKQFVEESAVGTDQPFISTTNLKKCKLPLPPKEEQKAIAQTLSDLDALIAALDKLIAKKRYIKTGTMQQLLTGKTRLPGFGEGKGYKKTEVGVIPEDWNLRRLGEVAKITMGQSPSSKYYNYKNIGIPLIQGNADIVNRYAVIRAYTSVITKKCNPGDIIMSVRAPVGHISKTSFEACIGRGVCSISYENDFLYHLLVCLESQWFKLSKGSTFDSINSDEIKSLSIAIPVNKEEQKAIAQVLSDIDTEITALEKRRAKTQAIKQGMMQELLTGRTRLKFEHPDDPITKNSNG